MAAPVVVTDYATNIGENYATLNGHCVSIDMTEPISYISFQWGETTSYGQYSLWAQALPNTSYVLDVSGLKSGTTYHFRVIGLAGGVYSYGADSAFQTLSPVTPPPSTPPPSTPGTFMGAIIAALLSISNFFYSLYLDTVNWIAPFNVIADFFYNLSVIFYNLSITFTDFSAWVSDIAAKVAGILSWDYIWGKIKEYAQPLLDILIGLRTWWDSVWSQVNTWWDTTKPIVEGWISTATQGLNDLIAAWDNFWKVTFPEWMTKFDDLKSAWDNFWKVTFPDLVSFQWLDTWWKDRLKDIDDLMTTKLKEWFPLYDDLTNLWDDIKLFFTAPLTWLVGKLEDWFWTEEEK